MYINAHIHTHACVHTYLVNTNDSKAQKRLVWNTKYREGSTLKVNRTCLDTAIEEDSQHTIRQEEKDLEITVQWKSKKIFIPRGIGSTDELLLNRSGELPSGDCFFSALRTEDKAAIAAALCEPGLFPDLGEEPDFAGDGELNAEFKAAKAEALWVDPP